MSKLKFYRKPYSKGGGRFGGASHYLDIDTTGCITDTGTQTTAHNFNDVDITNADITTLTVGTLDGCTAATVTTLTVTSAIDQVAAITKGGGASNYMSVGTDGAITDTGTQTHDLADVNIGTLTVTTAIDAVAGITKGGGSSNYMTVGADGAITDTGTQAHSLNDVTITTLTSTTLGAAKTRSLWFRPYDFKTSGSVSLSTMDTTWFGLVYTTTCPASATDSYLYSTFVVPEDVSTATAMNLYVYSMHTTTAASITHYIASASYLASGEITAPTGASSSCNYQHTSAGSANVIQKVDVGDLGVGFTAGDLVKMRVGYYSSGGSNTSVNDTIIMARVDYASLKAY